MSQFFESLSELLETTRAVVRGNEEAVHRLNVMTGSVDEPPMVVELAELINHLAVQKDAREFRLELMIEDLLATHAALESAKHDALTGLPNRGLFHELLNQACANAQRKGQTMDLMFVELDRFKQVNDSMGHDAGDELLIQVSQRLSACVREGDIVARLGGDEFTVVLCQLDDKKTGIQIAERILADLKTTFSLSMGCADIGSSVGVSFFPHDAIQPLSLLKNADVAMYQAKEAGRNTYRLYRPGMGGGLLK